MPCCIRNQQTRPLARNQRPRAAAGAGSASVKKSKPEPVPVMDYRQYRRARRLVHECCNYDGGNCIALDDREECVRVQSISYSLLCRTHEAYRGHPA